MSSPPYPCIAVTVTHPWKHILTSTHTIFLESVCFFSHLYSQPVLASIRTIYLEWFLLFWPLFNNGPANGIYCIHVWKLATLVATAAATAAPHFLKTVS